MDKGHCNTGTLSSQITWSNSPLGTIYSIMEKIGGPTLTFSQQSSGVSSISGYRIVVKNNIWVAFKSIDHYQSILNIGIAL